MWVLLTLKNVIYEQINYTLLNNLKKSKPLIYLMENEKKMNFYFLQLIELIILSPF